MKFLSIDGKLYKFMITLWDIVKLNFMWLVFSLPLITIGASTVAAYSVTLKMVADEEGDVVSQFIEAFKKNWKKGIVLGLITIAIAYFAYINFQFFNGIENNPVIFLISGIFIIFFGLLHLTYAYPLLARYENSVLRTMLNSKEIVFKFVFKTFILWFVIAILVIVFIYNYVLIFIGFLVGPVSIFLTISAFSINCFKQVEIDKESE